MINVNTVIVHHLNATCNDKKRPKQGREERRLIGLDCCQKQYQKLGLILEPHNKGAGP
jgi:hypothetical protein